MRQWSSMKISGGFMCLLLLKLILLRLGTFSLTCNITKGSSVFWMTKNSCNMRDGLRAGFIRRNPVTKVFYHPLKQKKVLVSTIHVDVKNYLVIQLIKLPLGIFSSTFNIRKRSSIFWWPKTHWTCAMLYALVW